MKSARFKIMAYEIQSTMMLPTSTIKQTTYGSAANLAMFGASYESSYGLLPDMIARALLETQPDRIFYISGVEKCFSEFPNYPVLSKEQFIYCERPNMNHMEFGHNVKQLQTFAAEKKGELVLGIQARDQLLQLRQIASTLHPESKSLHLLEYSR